MPQTERIYPFQERETATSVEHGTIESVDLLAEVKLALQYLNREEDIPENVYEYITVNEQTKAHEATTSVIHTTVQAWDPGLEKLSGYGIKTTTDFLEDGLVKARLLQRVRGKEYDFEVERREQELADAIQLEKDIASGKMDYMVKATISAFPWGEDPEVLNEIGYFTRTRTTMLRVHEYDPDKQILITNQLPIENSVVNFWSEITSRVRNEYFERDRTPADILASQIYLPKSRYPEAHITIAQAYDALLEEAYGKKHFLGEEIEDYDNAPDYDDLKFKSENTKNSTARYIEEMVEVDINLARSLKDSTANKDVQKLLQEAAASKDENGNFLLDFVQRKKLTNAMISGSFTLEEAAILKKFSLIRTYNTIKTISEPGQASKIFGPEMVQKIQELHRQDSRIELVHQEVYSSSNRQLVYYFCGGKLGGESQLSNINALNSFQLPTSEFINTLNSGGEAKYVKNCGKCGVSIEKVIAKNYKCSSCGGRYEGC